MPSDPKISDAAYLDSAKRLYKGHDGDIDFDGGAKVSRNDDGEDGAFVQAWVWVPNENARPFFVVDMIEGQIGRIRQRDTWDEALEEAVKMAAEQCDSSQEQIRGEIEQNDSFHSADGEISVTIMQSD